MSALVPWSLEDQKISCGWCGHDHPNEHPCGCVPCPSCGGYHGPDDEETR